MPLEQRQSDLTRVQVAFLNEALPRAIAVLNGTGDRHESPPAGPRTGRSSIDPVLRRAVEARRGGDR